MNKEFLFKLLDSFGPSGFEEQTMNVFYKEMEEKQGFKIEKNKYNSCIVLPPVTGGKNVLIAGHNDEIGFMVSAITESGYLKVKSVGGIDPYILLGTKVKILNKYSSGTINGIFGSTAIHLLKERHRNIELKDLFIDIGAKNREDVEKNFNIEIGSPIVFADKRVNLGNGLVASKAADDRLGVFIASQVAINCKKCLSKVVAAITCQEENGLIGAQMLKNNISGLYYYTPDCNIIVDVTHSIDYPGVSTESEGEVKLGGGPVLAYGSVNNKNLVNKLKEVAKKNNIPFQISINSRYSGTDADELHLMLGGNVPTAVVSVPLRYMHTQSEVFDLDDVESTINLLTAFVSEF